MGMELFSSSRNCLMANDQSNKDEAEKLYTDALKIDPSNETVLTMFAIFKCNGFVDPSHRLFSSTAFVLFMSLEINLKTQPIYMNVQFIVLVATKNFFNMLHFSTPFVHKVEQLNV